MPIHVELLRKVKSHILEEPARFIMEFVHFEPEPGSRWRPPYSDLERTVPACGTVACIAGWTVALTVPNPVNWSYGVVFEQAVKALGLSAAQGDRLFETWNWPSDFARRWAESGLLEERARIAAERIEHFIATNGME